MELKTYFAQDASGNIMPGAAVTVYLADTLTLATGLLDENESALTNPFNADSDAKVAFYAPDGIYDINVVSGIRNVTIRAQFVGADAAIILRDDLAETSGAALVGADDGASGTLWTNVEGFINKVRTVGASLIPFSWSALATEINKIEWGIQTANSGVSLLRYIPPAEWPAIFNYSSTYDATADIQAWIDGNRDRFAPAGLYRYTGKITINEGSPGGGQGVIRGAGMDRTIFRAMTNAAACFVNETHRHDNIHIRDISIDANNIGTNCMRLGVDGSIGVVGASSANQFERVKFALATGNGVELEYCQYFDFVRCIFSTNGGYALWLDDSAVMTLESCLFTSNRCGIYFGGDNTATNPSNVSASNTITLNQCRFYGPYSGAAEGYLHFDNAYNITLNQCYLEHEITHSQPLVRIGRNGAAVVTAEINFNECVFNGVPYNTDIVSITYGQRIRFRNCTSFKPNAGFYIVRINDVHASVEVEDCRVNNGSYSTFNAALWTDTSGAILVSAGTLVDKTYRQGSCTARLTDGTNVATMSAVACRWQRKGRELTISGNVSTSALAGTPGTVSGNIYIDFSDLSFTAAGFAGGTVSSASGFVITAGQSATVMVDNGGTRLSLMLWDLTTGTSRLQASEWSDDGNIAFTITFPVA